MNHSDLVIGVDAGGSKTTAWVATRAATEVVSGDSVLGQGTSGPANPRTVGFKAAQFNIGYAVAEALAGAQLEHRPVASACLGVAGAGRATEQKLLKKWARKSGMAENVLVTDDVEPVLAAASPEHIGIALISGTGSLAWGRNPAGETGRTGGWGHLFGDEGSGYAIAVAALRAAAQAADGRAPATALLPLLQVRLDAQTPPALIERIYDRAVQRPEIAALADIVFSAADSDNVARQIVEDAAQDLARLVRTLTDRLKFGPAAFALAMAGGVLISQPAFRARVVELIGVSADHVSVVEEPVAGAVALARRSG